MVATPDHKPDVSGAISQPARRRVLDLLAQADRSADALAGHFQVSRPAASSIAAIRHPHRTAALATRPGTRGKSS